ncbi:FG-GAP and VCBS repeat-containing protein [Streptomyces sp. NPDC046805]|uniref:FG-GAP and VCBS repeat-containing protein n=1 Tax=Streptomyces sp. NPDC046805 TaxID=3155134 RepID=UPI0033D41E0D
MRRATPAAVAAALLAAGLSPLALTTPAAATTAKYADDFNGDGYRDYATPWQGDSKGGGILVTFGTADGPGTTTQFISQSSPGVPGADEADDMFGDVRTAADFNADGYGDLAVAARGEDVDGRKDQGAVTVLWGSASGLSGGTVIPNKAPAQSYGYMGDDLAAGDFNGDGHKDLAVVNASKTYVYRGAITRTGVHGSVSTLDKETSSFSSTALIAGNVNGDSKTDLVIVGDVWSPDGETADAWFVKGGSTLTSGPTLHVNPTGDGGGDGVIADFDKDGYGDVAIGTPAYSGHKGRVSLWYGSSTGPATSARISQSTSGVSGTPETDDSFGESISAGDVNGDGYKDLAIGAYGETIDGVEYAGIVHVLRGRSSGVTGTGSQTFARNTAGVPGALGTDDMLGYVTRLRDTNRDGYADLYVSGNAGSLRFPGSASGTTTTGVTSVESAIIEGMVQ